MKKFISLLIVAMLVIGCMATAAFAVEANAGDTVTLGITVSGEFSNFVLNMGADSGLTIVSFNGILGNTANGMVNYASAVNTNSVSFTVTVKVADGIAPGNYYVYGSVARASVLTEEGELVAASNISVSGNVVTITCDHAWGDWTVTQEATCTEAGERTRACTKCGQTQTEAIAALGHEASAAWSHDTVNHWHVCVRCDAILEEEAHFWHWVQDRAPNSEEQINGLKHKNCYICGHNWAYTDIPWDTDPEGGDMTYDISSVAYGVVAMISMVASAAFVTKRKSL